MAKQLLTPLQLIGRMNFSLKNYGCELFYSFQLLQQLFAKAGI